METLSSSNGDVSGTSALQRPNAERLEDVQYIANVGMKEADVVLHDSRGQIEDIVDVSTPFVLGFIAGWFTWVFGLALLAFGGDGKRTAALRRGLILGICSVTLPLIAILGGVIVVIQQIKELLNPLPDTPSLP